jgi:hypothetical protein
MAKNETRRNSPQVLSEDGDALDALKGIQNYTPANENYTVAKLDTAKSAMEAAQLVETQAEAAFKAARDAAVAKEWAFHNAVLGAKKQVVAQFGDDSDEAQAIGLKKKSEWKAPQRNNKPVVTPSNN